MKNALVWGVILGKERFLSPLTGNSTSSFATYLYEVCEHSFRSPNFLAPKELEPWHFPGEAQNGKTQAERLPQEKWQNIELQGWPEIGFLGLRMHRGGECFLPVKVRNTLFGILGNLQEGKKVNCFFLRETSFWRPSKFTKPSDFP